MGDDTAERVLTVPTRAFHAVGHFQGFSSRTEEYLDRLLTAENLEFRLRSEAELDPHYKQLIPYVVLRHGNTFFRYRRDKGGEKRLQALRSLGLGGHVNPIDADSGSPLGKHTYERGLRRELEEEVRIATNFELTPLGLINDDQTEVGRVHLGIVHLADLAEPHVIPREAGVAEAGFVTAEEILADLASYETWSQICVQVLLRHQVWKRDQAADPSG